MKITLINLTFGYLVIWLCWIITFNNQFVFGLFTPVVMLLIFIVFYYFTTSFNWIVTIIGFLAALFITGIVIDFIVLKFPNLELVDDQSFPRADYFFYCTVSWVVSKLLLDVLLYNILKTRHIRKSKIENFFFN